MMSQVNFLIDKSTEMLWTISPMTVCQHPILISWHENPRINNKLNYEACLVNGQGLHQMISDGKFFIFLRFVIVYQICFIIKSCWKQVVYMFES